MKNITLLDTTLRDGSYAIDFKFSQTDVEIITASLEAAGVEYIEIGHGVGLGASFRTNELALCTDEEYLLAAQRTLKKSKYGMFCIPGIATLDDLKLAASYGMSFVRVGSNVEDVQKTVPFIREAKKLGMMVAANYMKSYTAEPRELAEKVKISESAGADFVYIVDSAGGMLPKDIRAYTDAIRQVSTIKLGYHGHNNLGMAVANSLMAAELDFDIIDASVGGLGRSAGNAATELLLPALKLAGFETGIDLYKIMELGEKCIAPLVRSLTSPLDIICGYAKFHTSYMKYIMQAANKYRVSPLKLIEKYSEVDRVNMDYAKLCEVAETLPQENTMLGQYRFGSYFGNEQDKR